MKNREFQKFVKILNGEKPISDVDWERYNAIYLKQFIKDVGFEAGIDPEFVPRLIVTFENTKNLKTWLDSPLPALHGATPRQLRNLPNGKHLFQMFTARYPR